MSVSYKDQYQQSIENPEQFWAEAASGLEWIKPWDKVLDDSRKPFYEWFSGGEINTCHNALDRHCSAG
ncbi:MAG: propionyl-CoA synthetase, partial [Xanthomonadales bacterium]|nr:propionyl-CoA synthetase [Xanthomonadales bacterium]